jgi:hypothetical protein
MATTKLPPRTYTEADYDPATECLVPVFRAHGRGRNRSLTVHFDTIISKIDLPLYEAHRTEWRGKWSQNGKTWYVVRHVQRDGSTKAYYLHREILRLTHGDPRVGDHQDHDTQRNTRRNLRSTDDRGSMVNRRKFRNARSVYKGVSTNPARQHPHRAGITAPTRQKSIFLGDFHAEAEAALAWDLAAWSIYRHHNLYRPLNSNSPELRKDHPEQYRALRTLYRDRPLLDTIYNRVRAKLRKKGVLPDEAPRTNQPAPTTPEGLPQGRNLESGVRPDPRGDEGQSP